MRKFLSTAVLLMAVVISGCSQEKAQVETYLNARQASNDAMKATAKEMESSMSGLQKEIQAGNFDAEAIKAKIGEFEDKMKEEKGKVEGLSVPEKAKLLQDTTVKQYETAITVLSKTPGMIDIAKKMSDSAQKMKKDPKAAKAVMAEMQESQGEMMKIQQEVMELAKQGQELDKTAKTEEQKLRDEFQLAKPGETPAPVASGAPAAEVVATPAMEMDPAAVETPAAN